MTTHMSKVDRLRDSAMRVEAFLEGDTDAIPMDIHEQLLDAADTILELRDDLQRANNAVQDAEHDESMAWDRVRKAEAENAKLRELAANAWQLVMKHAAVHPSDLPKVDAVRDRMSELGIEVTGK